MANRQAMTVNGSKACADAGAGVPGPWDIPQL
jgi:hypothetical protein